MGKPHRNEVVVKLAKRDFQALVRLVRVRAAIPNMGHFDPFPDYDWDGLSRRLVQNRRRCGNGHDDAATP